MASPSGSIYFHNQYGRFYFPSRNPLKEFIASFLRKKRIKLDTINVIFCTDEELRRINKEYLKHDYYTDIVTFQTSAEGEPLLSDIFISIDRVKENALSYETTFTHELHRVIFHGILHLIGYKDKSSADVSEMRLAESKLLSAYLRST